MNGEGGAEADDAGRDAKTVASTSGEPIEQNGSFVPPSIRSGEHGELGPRRTMEDASSCREGVVAEGCDDPLAFYCLFDGHGGRGCAEFLNERLVANITSDPSFAKDPAQAMRDAFQRTDEDFRASMGAEGDASGSTALALCVRGGKLLVANAGDCRAVLSRRGRAADLSTDQRPSCSTEMSRIEAAGGYVEDSYINGHLGVARAFGDFHIEGLKGKAGGEPGPLIATPEVETHALTHEDEFVIMACDGLWDVFSSHNAVDFTRLALRRHNDPSTAARELALEALRRDSCDNVTVIVVCFSDDPPPDKRVEGRTAPMRFGRTISSEGLSSLQKAIRDDDEAAIEAIQNSPAPAIRPQGLTRVSSINPSSPSRGKNLSGGFLNALDNLDLSMEGSLTPLAEETNTRGSPASAEK